MKSLRRVPPARLAVPGESVDFCSLVALLDQIPSIFGQMVCLAEDLPFTSDLTSKMSCEVVGELHASLFRRWLQLEFKHKESDLVWCPGMLAHISR